MSRVRGRFVGNVIVGAGPAGLQMAQCMASAGRDYVVLESGCGAGTFFTRYPRHEKLLSINKKYNWFPEPEFNLRHDWNSLLSDDDGPRMTDLTEELFPRSGDLVDYLTGFAEHFDLAIEYGSRVTEITRDQKGGFRVTMAGPDSADDTVIRCRRVFLATGPIAPAIPDDIEGIELAEGYEDHSTNASDYRNQRVAIIGQGNSAFEVADHLAGQAAIIHIFLNKPLKHAWETHFPGDLRAVNNSVLDMYQLKSLHATVGFRIRRIEKSDDESGLRLRLETEFRHWDPPRLDQATFSYDRVIRCTGWRYADPGLFAPGEAPETDERGKFFRIGPTWETSVPGVFCIGTSMQQRDRTAASSFIHGFRYNVRSLFRILEERDHGVPLPGWTAPLATDEDQYALAGRLVKRISTTSGLFQQFGVLADVIAVRDGVAEVHEEIPVAHIPERADLGAADSVVALTLEYGFDRYPGMQALDFVLPPDFSVPECSAFLHPVLRRWDSGELVEELHVNESLVVRYDVHYDHKLDVDGHRGRIRNFFNRITRLSADEYSEAVYEREVPPELRLADGAPATDGRCRALVRDLAH